MLDSIDQMTLKRIKTRIFCVNTSRFCHLKRNVMINGITERCEICTPLVVYRALYHSQTRRNVINKYNNIKQNTQTYTHRMETTKHSELAIL